MAHPARLGAADVVRAVRDRPTSRPAPLTGSDARPAAVLIVVADDPAGDAGVLLTRRNRRLRANPGEISFPGGRLEPGESPEAAAVREAHEEVGLDPVDVELVGTLDHLVTIAHPSYVVPVVARVQSQLDLTPAPDEVERILWVPLAELVRPDTYRVERWGQPPMSRLLYFYELDDETIWGATGRILTGFLTRLLLGSDP